jgi:hypothetical protein
VAAAGSGALVGVGAGAHAPRIKAAMINTAGTGKNRFIFFVSFLKYSDVSNLTFMPSLSEKYHKTGG